MTTQIKNYDSPLTDMFFLKRWEKRNDPAGDKPQRKLPALFFWRKDFLFALILSSLNFILLWPFLGREYPQVSFSTPLLPFLAQGLKLVTPLSFPQIIGSLVLLSFPLASLTWYIFFRQFSRSSLVSFLAGLIFLLPWFYLPRFAIFWQQGDGIHSLGFAVLPLAGLLVWQFLKVGSFNWFLASFLGVGFISLISPFSLLNLYLFFLILTFSEMLLGEARIKVLRFFLVGLFAQGAVSFWYHPQFLLALLGSPQGKAALSSFWQLFPISFFTLPIIGAFSFLLFDRRPYLQPLFFGLTSTLLYLALVAAESFGGYLMVSVPDRFFPEFYVVLAFFLAILINFLLSLPSQKLVLEKIHPRLAFPHHASELFLTTLLTALLVWPAFSLVSQTPIIPPFTPPQVLGVQAPWWEITRDGVSQVVGYGLTALTALAGVFLKKRVKT